MIFTTEPSLSRLSNCTSELGPWSELLSIQQVLHDVRYDVAARMSKSYSASSCRSAAGPHLLQIPALTSRIETPTLAARLSLSRGSASELRKNGFRDFRSGAVALRLAAISGSSAPRRSKSEPMCL